MARVFVIQDSHKRDFSDARRYGELVPLIERDVFPDDADERVETIRKIMLSKLADFNHYDSLLLTGDPLAIVIASLTVSLNSNGFWVLKWDRENKRYYRVWVEV